MTQEAHRENHFDPENYPALMEFLPAYFHEDFVVEYGSASQAFSALISDASEEQIRNVKEEWLVLRKSLSGKPWHDVQRALGALGTAWHPQSEEELQAIDEILRGA